MEVVDGILGPKLDPAGGLECGEAGLKANFPAAVGESPDACNGLEIRGNGLYAPCPDAVTGIVSNDSVNNDLIDGAGLAIAAPGGPYMFGAGAANTLANPLCCDVSGIIAIRAGGLYLDAADGFYGKCHLEIDANGTGWVPAVPDTTIVFENQSGSNLHTAFNNLVDENHIVIPASGSITYTARVVVTVIAGSGTLTGLIQFEYVLTCPQTGCC
jgi:hypothetical protein